MDTTYASPNRPSIAPRLFGLALSIGVGLWLALIAADLAVAQTAPQSARVTYSDLDLSTPDGASTLLRRISGAAREACGEENHSPLFPRAMAQHRACVTDAVSTAVKRIDAPLVAAIHDQAPAGASYASR